MISEEVFEDIIDELAQLERVEKSINIDKPSAYHSGKMTGYHTAIEIIKRKVKGNDTTDRNSERV